MKKELKIIMAIVTMIIVALAFAYFAKLTGYAVVSSASKVARNVSFSEGEIKVKLNISSSQNIIAISEILPKNSKMISYNLSGDYEVFEFNPSTNEWIISDKSKEINTELDYTFQNPLSGKVTGTYSYVQQNKVYAKPITGASSYKVK